MATGDRSKAIDRHNVMVYKLSKNITTKELYSLKQLLRDAPLTPVDIATIQTVQDLFNCLINYKFISYGDYKDLLPKLKLLNAVLYDILNEEQGIISDSEEAPVISMDKKLYRVKEGNTAFLDCTVDPTAKSIVWKKDKSPPLKKRVPSDNRKFYYGTKSPTLVIRDSDKEMDEAHYQCTAEGSGKLAHGDVVELQISADTEPTTSKGATMTSDDPTYSQSPVSECETSQQKQGIHRLFRFFKFKRSSHEEIKAKKRSKKSEGPTSKEESQSQTRDQNCRIEFKANNDHGKLINRPQSRKDISDVFHNSTGTKERVKNVQMKEGSVQVCIDITPARNPSEPSSLHLAEEFKHYLLDGGTIQLSDESRTVLDVVESSFEITPHNAPEDGIPFVNISHGKFTVLVGKTAFIQTYIIASPRATSIQWFKKENEKNIPIEIDNKRHFGGCDDCPTLIIRETNIDDQGQYICSATNSNGTGSSDISVLSVQSDGEDGLQEDDLQEENIERDADAVKEEDVVGKDADAEMEDVDTFQKGDDAVMAGSCADRKDVDIGATKLVPSSRGFDRRLLGDHSPYDYPRYRSFDLPWLLLNLTTDPDDPDDPGSFRKLQRETEKYRHLRVVLSGEFGVLTESGYSKVETTSSSAIHPMAGEALTDQNYPFRRLTSGDDTFLHLCDMSGHMSSHSIFISSHGVYLLVFRLTDFLKDKLESDRLKKWIRLIGTFSSDELNTKDPSTKRIVAPPIIFVGTFLDDLKKTSKDYNNQIENIRMSIIKFPELSTLRFVKFCTVDNGLGDDDTELETLRGFITEAAKYQDQRQIPTTWLKFELDLFKAREQGTRILTMTEVIERNTGSKAPLKDVNEIKHALEYLHCTRSVIYFREIDFVVTDPQWLADFFSILNTDDEFLPKDDPLLNRDLELYKTKGELTQKLIEGLLCMKRNKAFAPFKSHLLAVMEKFGLIVNILLSKSDAEATKLGETYIIPSKLTELQQHHINEFTDEVESFKRKNLAVSKTLCFVFDDVYIPYELFHRTLAQILRSYRTTPLSTRNFAEAAEGSQSQTKNTGCLYMNFGCFEVDDLSRMILSLHAERSTIAVTVFSPTESNLPANSGKRVRLSIERILQETLQMSNQQHFRYSHQLHCNFHLSPFDTPVQLYDIIHFKKGVPCKGGECQERHRLLKTDAEYWDVIEDTKTQGRGSTSDSTFIGTNIPERRPTPRELGRISRLVDGSSCEMLFIELGIPYPEIEDAKRESSTLASITLTTKMLIKWTLTYPNQTFHHLKMAMENVGMATDRIPEVIKTNEKSSCQGIVPNEVWIRVPFDDEISQIVDNIDNAYFNLCLELGLSPPVINQHVLCHPLDFQERMAALLRCWIKKCTQQATIGRLLTAMEVCQMDWRKTAQIWSTEPGDEN